ncbi:Mediator of RNA polymerase II transcription subunit 7a [Zea mays]|uniref:Mediator of RNA polymerase II transcription subunit 7a n=1 Tax=Zea mays TaxID=4577 RepID=C0HEF1_MAIZE|nr:unknown [Zea mays]ONM12603.1 Mediator of RNA polymerase II transcription subunit 7a [Zea mays]
MAMATSASYPPPPPFYRLYKNFEQDPSSAPEPPPPIDEPFKALGVDYTVCFIVPPLLICY